MTDSKLPSLVTNLPDSVTQVCKLPSSVTQVGKLPTWVTDQLASSGYISRKFRSDIVRVVRCYTETEAILKAETILRNITKPLNLIDRKFVLNTLFASTVENQKEFDKLQTRPKTIYKITIDPEFEKESKEIEGYLDKFGFKSWIALTGSDEILYELKPDSTVDVPESWTSSSGRKHVFKKVTLTDIECHH